ncbi:conserved exported hypothetical protein [Hyphomicrobiales bacterium]|nr:conserved exported hypothetical protein [Hyphomicrobiales bacterium]CAH1701062.1 conserved exported hypothetical protein [Hyphomicrobiales bacterium]CAI0344121.1 conserved exported hypothetical protein [Hyphomicrobiales bacterium]
MLRLAIILSCGVCAAATLSAGASAAGRGLGPGTPARMVPMRPHVVHPVLGGRPWRGAVHRHRGWRDRGVGWGDFGYPWPWYDGSGTAGGVTVIERQPEAPRPVDPDAFENLTARAGIRPAPTPEPTIYRLEGPRSRPTARVIRVGGSDAALGGARSRFAHAETGALLLTVPGR